MLCCDTSPPSSVLRVKREVTRKFQESKVEIHLNPCETFPAPSNGAVAVLVPLDVAAVVAESIADELEV